MGGDEIMKGREIAEKVGLEYIGGEFEVNEIKSSNEVINNSITFAKNIEIFKKICSKNVKNVVVVTIKEVENILDKNWLKENGIIFAENPRLAFIKCMNVILGSEQSQRPKSIWIHPTAIIENDVEIGEGCEIGAFVYIGPRTKLGRNVKIYPHVVIYGDTEIGSNTIIHSGCVIGKPGFGYERDEKNNWLRFPHIGRVKIGENVEIGANTVIDKGALETTEIGDGTKIDNLVHVAHGVKIGKNCIIVACVQLGGSDIVEDNSWIGPNTSMIEGIRIGKKSLIGVGSVVVKDIPDNTVVAGNPAMPIEEFKKIRDALKKLSS